MTKISIIVPVYNVEEYLERCLDSIVNQTLKDVEIIIVNDGSKDGSLAICERYAQKDNRIKIVTQKNAGLGAARNTGMKYATGEYVGFIDSDDWIDLDFYEKLYNTAKEHDADIAYADFIRKGKNKHKIRMHLSKVEVSTEIHDKIEHCKNLSLGCVWNKIYRRPLLQDNHLTFPVGKLFEDGIFSMQSIYYANKVVSTPGTYYYYFVNPTSIVKSAKTQKKIDDVILCQHDILNFIHEKKINLKPEQFLTVMYKLKFWFLTLLVIKKDLFLKKYYLFGSMPVLTIYRGNKDRIFGKCLGIKFNYRKNMLSEKQIEELNAPYEKGEKLIPKVVNETDTLDLLVNSNKSICRFGDGEFNLMFDEGIPFQEFNTVLKDKLFEILQGEVSNVMVGIPDRFGKMDECAKVGFWRKYMAYNREKLYTLLNFSKTYYDSLISRVYIKNPDSKDCEKTFDKFKSIWNNKDIVIVEGEASRLGVGNDLFSGAKSISRILCPAKNAFSKYDEILNTCKSLDKDRLFILALGPTATVLAYDLANDGYRALDLGHLDIEYEWWKMGTKKKVAVKNKYTNETKNGKQVSEIKDEKYSKEIYGKIL